MKGKGKYKAKLVKARATSAPQASAQPAGKALELNGAKVIDYGKGNKLPNEIITTFLASPTARRCWIKLKKFIQADGFANRTAAAVRANPQQTTEDLVPLIAWDSAVFGFVLRVKYNLGKEVGEVYHVPFHTVRKLDDGRFLVNPNLGTDKYKKDEDEILDAFDNTEEGIQRSLTQVSKDGKPQPGQILYVFEEASVHPHYPEPAAWAGKEDMLSDTEIPRADHHAIKKRVKPNMGLFIPGDIDDETPDEDGKTDWDKIEETAKQLTDPEGEGDVAVFNGANKDDAPQLFSIDSMKSALSMDQKSDTITKRVCRHWGVHPSLIGMDTAGQLGNTQQLLNIIQLMQQEVLDIQGLIQRTFEKLWPAFDFTLTSLNIIKAMPEQAWQAMTEDEKRNFLGYPILETEQTTEGQKTLNALNSLPALVANKVLESMTRNQVLALVGLDPVEGGDELPEQQAEAKAEARFKKFFTGLFKASK
ncbi:hypothetical protein OB13_15035 [Pontibacter sp. HJ8]